MVCWEPSAVRRHTATLGLISLLLAACSKGPSAGGTQEVAGPTASAAVAAGPTTTQATATPPAAPTAFSFRVTGRIHASLPAMNFTLTEGELPHQEGLLRVHSIDIRQTGDNVLLQRIAPLDTATPQSAESPGFELVDMNFDGYADMRLIEFQPAGPNVPYLNWLYDPVARRYEPNPALNALSSPQFDAQLRQIRAHWRDNAAREGIDSHEFRDGVLTPLVREVRERQRPGITRHSQWRWDGHAWVLVGSRETRIPE